MRELHKETVVGVVIKEEGQAWEVTDYPAWPLKSLAHMELSERAGD